MEASRRISLYLADDHPMYLEGLARAAKERPDLELVGQSRDGRQALADIGRLQPSVALIDMRMPGLGGSELLTAVKRDGLATRIVFLSAYGEADLVYSAIVNRAAGYLSKEADRNTISTVSPPPLAARSFSRPISNRVRRGDPETGGSRATAPDFSRARGPAPHGRRSLGA